MVSKRKVKTQTGPKKKRTFKVQTPVVNKSLFACGCSDIFANLGILDENGDVVYSRKFPSPVHGLQNMPIIKIDAGAVHSAAILEGGKLWIWGTDDDCAVGRGEQPSETPGPLEQAFYKQGSSVREIDPSTLNITDIALGDCHSLFLTDKGEMFSCGTYRNDNGIIGYNGEMLHQPRFTNLNNTSRNFKVVSIAAGAHADVCLTSSGAVLEWGDIPQRNTYSLRLSNRLTPRPVHLNALKLDRRADKPVAVFSTDVARFILTKSGRVFAWGLNGCGQCGLDSESYAISEPQHVPALDGLNVVKIVGGDTHTVALTADGKLFVWGMNEYGQLGVANDAIQHYLGTKWSVTELYLPDRAVPIDIGAGSTHTLVAVQEGRPFAFGLGSSYQCGNGRGDEEETTSMGTGDRIDPCVWIPERVGGQRLSTFKVKSVAGSALCSMFLGEPLTSNSSQ